MAGMVDAEECTLEGVKAEGCGRGEPRDAHRRLTMSVMREMLLLAEQMKLRRRAGQGASSEKEGRRWSARDERLPFVLLEDADPFEVTPTRLELALELGVAAGPVGIEGSERTVELEVGTEPCERRVGREVCEEGRVRWLERVQGAVVQAGV